MASTSGGWNPRSRASRRERASAFPPTRSRSAAWAGWRSRRATASCSRLALTSLSIKLIIAGDGRLRSELESQAAALGLAPQVSFLGARSDIADILRALDICVMPSLWEGLSIAMLEAMAAGLPLVISDVSGVAQAFGEEDCGIRVPPRDVAALAQAIRDLAQSPERRKKLGEAGGAGYAPNSISP